MRQKSNPQCTQPHSRVRRAPPTAWYFWAQCRSVAALPRTMQFSQQALHDLTLAGERSQTLILYPKREGFRVPTTRSPVFSGAALGERVKCFVGKAGQDPTSM